MGWVQDLGGECDGQRQPGLGRRGNKDQMIAVRLQFAQSSVREAARQTGQSGEFYSPPRVAELAGSQEPAAKSVRVTAAGESRDGRHEAEQVAAADTLYIYPGESNQHLPTPRPAAETDCRRSSVLRRHGHIRTLSSSSSCLVAEAGGWRLQEGDSSGHERTSALADD